MTFTNFSQPPRVIAVPNIDHQLFPEKSLWPFWRKKKRDPLPAALAVAEAVLVPHRRLKNLLAENYGIPAERIHVIGHGLPERGPSGPMDQVTRRITKEVYGREQSYFLAPALGLAYDNTDVLVWAYDRFRSRCPEPVRLLLAGEQQYQSRKVRKAIRAARHAEDISFLPRLSPREQAKVLAAARASVHLSASTAFPVSILEAWHAEVPVVATDNDILQGAGALVQGADENSLVEALVNLVTTPFLASGLVENGKRRREHFTWEKVEARVSAVI